MEALDNRSEPSRVRKRARRNARLPRAPFPARTCKQGERLSACGSDGLDACNGLARSDPAQSGPRKAERHSRATCRTAAGRHVQSCARLALALSGWWQGHGGAQVCRPPLAAARLGAATLAMLPNPRIVPGRRPCKLWGGGSMSPRIGPKSAGNAELRPTRVNVWRNLADSGGTGSGQSDPGLSQFGPNSTKLGAPPTEIGQMLPNKGHT